MLVAALSQVCELIVITLIAQVLEMKALETEGMEVETTIGTMDVMEDMIMAIIAMVVTAAVITEMAVTEVEILDVMEDSILLTTAVAQAVWGLVAKWEALAAEARRLCNHLALLGVDLMTIRGLFFPPVGTP